MPHYFSFHPLPTTDRQWRPKSEELAPNCPRCDSSNTKFCYYNNYCLTQPRYLCKGCRRYWTKGGSLRNIPVGGGCRKSRRGNSVKRNPTVSSSLSSPKSALRPDHALESMSGRTGGGFLSPDQFLHQNPQLELQEAVDFVEKRVIGEKSDFSDVRGSGLGEVMLGFNGNYLMGSSNYGMETETDLVWESWRFEEIIGMAEMAQQSAAGLSSLEAFL